MLYVFKPFWSLLTKAGEAYEFDSLQAGPYGWCFYILPSVYISCILIHLVLWVVTPKLDGRLLLICCVLLHAYSSLILLHTCWITSVTIFHHAFQILHMLCQMRVWITRYRGRSPWFNSSNVHCLKRKFLTMHIFRGSSSISCNQIPQYQYLHFIWLSPLKT